MRLARVLAVLFLTASASAQAAPVPMDQETATGTAAAAQQHPQLPDGCGRSSLPAGAS